MPASTRPRKAADLQVPDRTEQSGERKRVLNVLAQRRYRQRKKEQFEALKHRVEKQSKHDSIVDDDGQASGPGSSANHGHLDPVPYSSLEPMPPDSICESSSLSSSLGPSTPLVFDVDDLSSGVYDYGTETSTKALSQAWDPSVFFPLSALPAGPEPSDESTSGSSLNTPTTADTLGADELNLPMLELNLLRAAMGIADRVGVTPLLWNIHALSPLPLQTTTDYGHLPLNLRPTAVQLFYPHHPMFDILPWPAVRDRLIMVFAQPAEMRPPSAASSTALVDFAYDLEDAAEGVRVWGGEPHAAESWEVGQKLFSRWWWALDRDVVSRSNDLRLQRGAPPLSIGDDRVEELE